MRKAKVEDKKLVVDIITELFINNPCVIAAVKNSERESELPS